MKNLFCPFSLTLSLLFFSLCFALLCFALFCFKDKDKDEDEDMDKDKDRRTEGQKPKKSTALDTFQSLCLSVSLHFSASTNKHGHTQACPPTLRTRTRDIDFCAEPCPAIEERGER